VAHDFIQLPTDGLGKKLATDRLTTQVAGNPQEVHREQDRIAGSEPDELLDVRDTDPADDDYGAVVRMAPPVAPAHHATSSTVAAGGAATLQAPTLPSGVVGKLFQITVASSVAAKFELQRKDGATTTTIAVLFVGGLAGRPNAVYRPIHKDMVTLPISGAQTTGDELWQAQVTNLDWSEGDVYVTFEWDEVPV